MCLVIEADPLNRLVDYFHRSDRSNGVIVKGSSVLWFFSSHRVDWVFFDGRLRLRLRGRRRGAKFPNRAVFSASLESRMSVLLDISGLDPFFTAFFSKLALALLSGGHKDSEFPCDVVLTMIDWWKVVRGLADLRSSNKEVGKAEGVKRVVDIIVVRIVVQINSAEAVSVVGQGSSVPGLAELDVPERVGSEVGSSCPFVTTKFLIKVEVFGHLSHMNCGVYHRIIEILDLVGGWRDTSEQGMGGPSKMRLTTVLHVI